MTGSMPQGTGAVEIGCPPAGVDEALPLPCTPLAVLVAVASLPGPSEAPPVPPPAVPSGACPAAAPRPQTEFPEERLLREKRDKLRLALQRQHERSGTATPRVYLLVRRRAALAQPQPWNEMGECLSDFLGLPFFYSGPAFRSCQYAACSPPELLVLLLLVPQQQQQQPDGHG